MKHIKPIHPTGRTGRGISIANLAAGPARTRAQAVLLASVFWLAAIGCAFVSSALHAQTPASPAGENPATDVKTSTPRYTASDAKLAFNFLDANHDGKIDREEASRAKKVTQYFDQADVDHDGNLSLEEFTAALNQAKVTTPGT